MKNTSGGKSLIKKEDLDNVTCLKNEKSLLERKLEEHDEYLMRILKSELLRERKIKKVKDKINQKDKAIKKFLKNKNDGMKLIENERYQDNLNVLERQKIYEKIMDNYDKKINISKLKNSESQEKMEELKEQIKDYERKNKKYKQKIAEIFDLKDIDKDIKNNVNNTSSNSDPEPGRWKYINMEEKYEMERMKRESALMSNINQMQKKINGYLEKNEEKEKKIQNAIKDIERKREEKRLIQSMHFEDIREKVKAKQAKDEKDRKKKLENLEKKDLKDFAIKYEKIKMHEEIKKMNQNSHDEREAMKAKLKEIMSQKKNLDKVDQDEKIINKMIYS